MRTLLAVFLLLFVYQSQSQKLTKQNFTQLKKTEDTLKTFGRRMIMDNTASERFNADSVFIRMLVRTLKTPNSFYYPFDSLETVSHIYAPDSAFRIFSWQFMRDEDHFRQYGAIQMKTADGSLQLFPLLDISDYTSNPSDSVRSGLNWIGAIYYAIVMKTFNNKKYYTLLGFDDNNVRSTKKWIEVLSFNESGKPVFGGPFFAVVNDSTKAASVATRYCLEYKKEGHARLNYDKDLDMIVYDHLISEDNDPSKAYTMVPDGDYQGFKWDNGKWKQIDKVFDYKLQDGQAPVPVPLKDAKGNSDELKLQQQSEKNKQKARSASKSSGNKKPANDNEQSY